MVKIVHNPPFYTPDIDPPHYERDFEYQVFEETLKLIHPKLECFHKIKKIDFSHQLLGDERLLRLCQQLRGCKVQYLNLAGNRLTDEGGKQLGLILRSLPNLKSLNLSWNHITDKTLQYITEENHYSPSLEDIDLTYNCFTTLGAFYLNDLFQNHVLTHIHTIRIGGTVDRHTWGNEFLQILGSNIVGGNKLCNLRHIQCSEMTLSELGIYSLLGILCSAQCHVEYLNISHNLIASERLKTFFIQGMIACPNTKLQLQIVNCGFSVPQMKLLDRVTQCPQKRFVFYDRLTYSQQLQLCVIALYANNQCMRQYFLMKQQILNTWKLASPPRWNPLDPDYQSTPFYHECPLFFHDPKDMLPKGMKKTMYTLNEKIAHLYHLQVIRSTCEVKTMLKLYPAVSALPPNALFSGKNYAVGSGFRFSTQYQLQKQQEKSYQKCLNRLVQVEERFLRLKKRSDAMFMKWNEKLTQFMRFLKFLEKEKMTSTTVGYLKKPKWIIPPLETEQLGFYVEELLSFSQQKCEDDQAIIGTIFEKRTLYAYIDEYFPGIASAVISLASDGSSLVTGTTADDATSIASSQSSVSKTLPVKQQVIAQQQQAQRELFIGYEEYLQQKYAACIDNFEDIGYFTYYYNVLYHKDKE